MKSTKMTNRRVVLTGMGALTPLGTDPERLWAALRAGECGIAPLRGIDASAFSIKVGAQLPDDGWLAALPPGVVRRECRSTAVGLHAAMQALADAGLEGEARGPVAAYLGSGAGPVFAWADAWDGWVRRGLRGVRPLAIVHMMPNNAASVVSLELGLRGEHHVIAAACASATAAIGQAARDVAAGVADVVLAGGLEAPFEPGCLAAWNNLRVVSAAADPRRACRPFDRERAGLVLGEGAGMLVVEEAERARARGARIYAEILGYGASSDATHITQPSAEGQATAIRRAIQDADLEPSDIDYVNLHGTGTKLNDRVEAASLRAVFGATTPAASATKSMHGHMLGATGAVEAIVCALALRDGVVPPTINHETPDPDCDLDVTAGRAVRRTIRVAMSSSFAFGGNNSVLVLGRYDQEKDHAAH
jgi:3-oxoacyl-(acyl-carrier-protein) synthase